MVLLIPVNHPMVQLDWITHPTQSLKRTINMGRTTLWEALSVLGGCNLRMSNNNTEEKKGNFSLQ